MWCNNIWAEVQETANELKHSLVALSAQLKAEEELDQEILQLLEEAKNIS
jgi:hypothetical protein